VGSYILKFSATGDFDKSGAVTLFSAMSANRQSQCHRIAGPGCGAGWSIESAIARYSFGSSSHVVILTVKALPT
jgi:hypothetical protein